MAQTISQFIDMVRTKRDQDMAQKLQGLLPMLDQKIALEKAETEKAKAREDTYAGLDAMFRQYGYKEEDINTFKTRTAGVPYEQLPAHAQMDIKGRTAKGDLARLGVPLSGNEDYYTLGVMADTTSKATSLSSEGWKEYLEYVKTDQPEIALRRAQGNDAARNAQAEYRDWYQKELVKDSLKGSGGGGGGSEGGNLAPEDKAAWDKFKVYVTPEDPILFFEDNDGNIVYDKVTVDPVSQQIRLSNGMRIATEKGLIPKMNLNTSDRANARRAQLKEYKPTKAKSGNQKGSNYDGGKTPNKGTQYYQRGWSLN